MGQELTRIIVVLWLAVFDRMIAQVGSRLKDEHNVLPPMDQD
jgi:hypothetical protein